MAVSNVANKAFFSKTVLSSLLNEIKRFIRVDLPAFVYPTIQILGIGLFKRDTRMLRRDNLIASNSLFL